jgi:ABC-type glycerol-3-phosphate transport system permease component
MDAIQKKSRMKKNLNATLVTGVAAILLAIFLMPFLYMILTSLKTPNQFMILGSPFYPAISATFTYNGDDPNE